ncbi:hypothetical protein V8F33_011569 [Rhypophila sp. PSN 637]
MHEGCLLFLLLSPARAGWIELLAGWQYSMMDTLGMECGFGQIFSLAFVFTYFLYRLAAMQILCFPFPHPHEQQFKGITRHMDNEIMCLLQTLVTSVHLINHTKKLRTPRTRKNPNAPVWLLHSNNTEKNTSC